LTESSAVPEKYQLSFGYSQAEDRLVMLMQSGGELSSLLFTRRLTALLINGLADILVGSSAMASRAPEAMREDIVLMEHQSVMQQAQAAAPAPAPGPAPQPPGQPRESAAPMLVQTINIATHPNHFVLEFRPGEGASVTAALNRADLHRVLEVLKRRADEANWNLPVGAAWLSATPAAVTLN
jgi:hypothetical protein